MNYQEIKILGDLKASGYQPKSIKEELRQNLIQKLQKKEPVFEGIIGYEDTVIPDVERAILSRHNFILLGLRGQAKTRLARLMTNLLDEWIPVVAGSELNDDPFHPVSKFAKDLISEKGDNTPITWLHRDQRYAEKLATPDVSTADLVGDVDPIKAATLKLPYSDERVIHYGLVPHSNRSIFVINELPDLQPRIQVALFNILQEGDVQIRGYKMRLPLDIQFVFTANPEDYTNRGTIVTPLKDRIESQILTHYAKTIQTSKSITRQEARLSQVQQERIMVPVLMEDLVEQIAFEARESEYVDSKIGVSARLTISAFENLFSTAERRLILSGEKSTVVRLSDIWGVVPAITGKVELVYEGEQEGPMAVAHHLIAKAIKTQFLHYFPDPEKLRKKDDPSPYQVVLDWFAVNEMDILHDMPEKEYRKVLEQVEGLEKMVKDHVHNYKNEDKFTFMELVLHGLAETGQLNRNRLERGVQFKDFLSGMFFDEDFSEGD